MKVESAVAIRDQEVLAGGHLQALHVEPGDVLVVTLPGRATDAVCERIAQVLREGFGDDQQILVLDQGAQLGVLRPTSEAT